MPLKNIHPVPNGPLGNLPIGNTLPELPGDDGGTWRRVRVVPFVSTFCDNPDLENPEKNEFKIDKNLSEKLDSWTETFMSLLINTYKQYRNDECRIPEPYCVLEATNEYQKKSDFLKDFYNYLIILYLFGVLLNCLGSLGMNSGDFKFIIYIS